MMRDVMTIDGRPIGSGHPPYIIAELSGNHNGEIERAFALIEAASAAGAHAVKFQTYTADTITLDVDGPGFTIDAGLWKGRRLYDLYQEASTPWAWHEALFAKARDLGITAFSSPFDATAVDLLESLGAPAYKIASFELVDLPLIERVARTGKPLIMSTGLASPEEITEALAAAHGAGAEEIALLHCTSGYPAPASEMHLATMQHLHAQHAPVVVGLSDHTLGVAVSVAATALGASIIEKHVTLRRADGGPDAAFSLEPDQLRDLVLSTRTAWEALGSVHYERVASEASNSPLRRSLYVVEDIAAGEPFTARNVRSIRPGYGLPPKYYDAIITKTASRALTRGTPLDWSMVDE